MPSSPNPVSSALYLIAELWPDLSAVDAEAIAERLMDYVADQEATDTKTTTNFWLNGTHDIQ